MCLVSLGLGPAAGYLCFEGEGEGLESDILTVGDDEFSVEDWALSPSPREHQPLQLWVVVLSEECAFEAELHRLCHLEWSCLSG